MWEKTLETGSGFSGGYDGGSSFQSGTTLYRKVKSIQYGPDGRAYEYNLDLGAIPKAVKEAAKQYGWKFKSVLAKAKAAYPAGYMPGGYQQPYQTPFPNQPAPAPVMPQAAFCSNCGKPLLPEARFCDSCGQPQTPAAPVYAAPSPVSPQPGYQPTTSYQQPYQQPYQQSYPGQPVQAGLPRGKIKPPLLAGLVVLGVAVVTVGILGILGVFSGDSGDKDKLETKKTTISTTSDSKTTETTAEPTSGTTVKNDSSIVSTGVNLDDLGNIINGQFFFDDGKRQYYSSFDAEGAAHIYVTDKASGSTQSIFDGFGWSLVVIDKWLYFSGNEGKTIDATYNLFRIKLDGSGLERLNTGFCFNMSAYKDYLYYIKKTDWGSSDYTICRSNLDGSSEEVIVTEFNGYCVMYEKSLLYLGKDGILYKAQPDGSGATPLLSDSVAQVVIGHGKLIYTDTSGNIKIAGIDGKDIKQVRAAGSQPVDKLNSSQETIYYSIYDPAMVEGRNAYNYDLYRISFDGSGDQKIYSSLSYGTYVNIVGDKVYTLDYAIDPATGLMPAITIQMGLSGEGASQLYR